MTTWVLTTEQSDNRTHTSGEAPGRAEAVAALLVAAHERIRNMSVPARYTLDIDDEVVAIVVSTEDGNGHTDSAATLQLLERINLDANIDQSETSGTVSIS